MVEQAVQLALDLEASHVDGVRLCLRQMLSDPANALPLNLSHLPTLAGVGTQPVDLQQYNNLLDVR